MANGCDPQVGGRDCWDFDGPTFYVSDARFISSPTSLLLAPPANDYFNFICKYAPANNLYEGRVSSWQYCTGLSSRIWWLFLVNSTPGSAASGHCYRLVPITWPAPYVMRLLELVDYNVIRQWEKPADAHPVDQWYHWRISWHMSFGNLIVTPEYETVGAWWPICDPFTIDNPLHTEGNYARVGIMPRVIAGQQLYIDDTEISAYD